MTLQDAWQRSVLYFWASPNIMMAVAAGVLPIILHPRPFIDSFKSLRRMKTAGTTISLPVILGMFLSGTVGSVIFSYFLIPDFPAWIFLVLSVGWTFIINFVGARALGVTGIALDIPFIKEGTILALGGERYDLWFAPVTMPISQATVYQGTQWCGYFKLAELTSTMPTDLVKAYVYALPLGLILGFVYMQMFWSISSIPSGLFPAPFWDINVTMTKLFISRQLQFFRVDWMLGALAVCIVLQGLSGFLKVPISLMGLAIGATWPIANAFGLLVGFFAGKILEKHLGKSWIAENRSTIAAGMLTGEGLIVAMSTGLSMIFKSIWVRPI